MPETVRDTPVRSWQRHLVAVLAVVAVLHSAILVLWLAPSSPARSAVGTSNLTTYVNPYFQQSWGVLDPSAQFLDESFRMRAHVKDDSTGKDRVTEWIDVTSAEGGALRHTLDPARVHVIARKLATNLNGAMYDLNAAQRKLVQTNYITTPLSTLRGRLAEAGDRPAVDTYMKYDLMATRFASMYAKAKFSGTTILEVQYLIGRRKVPSYADRKDTSLKDQKFAQFAFGYRAAFKGSYEAQSAFDDYVEK